VNVTDVGGALAGELAWNALGDLREGDGSEEEQKQASNHGRKH